MSLYQVLDVLVHSSKIGESCGNSINEAMHWNKPVVVNSTPWADNGQLEQVDHGITGYIASTPQIFARAVENLYKNSDLRQKMGQSGKNKIVKLQLAETVTAQYEKLYVQLLNNKDVAIEPDLQEKVNLYEYSIDNEEIENFPTTYASLLKNEFDKLSFGEKFINYLLWPRKFYRKVIDYIDANIKK